MTVRDQKKYGFTLIEMLAALTVFSVLILILANVVSFTSQAININGQNLEAAEQGRMVLDRIGNDLAARVNRPDVGMVFTKNSIGSDCFRFYSQVNSYADNTGATPRGIAGVGYWVPSTITSTGRPPFQLERGATETDFKAGNNLFFLPSTLSPADITASDNSIDDYEILGNGVFRLEFSYLLSSGKLSIKNPNSTSTDFTGIAGIVIALAVLDDKTYQLLSSPNTQLSALSSALPKTSDGDDPLSDWNVIINAAGFEVNGIPTAVTNNIRIYERAFYIQ